MTKRKTLVLLLLLACIAIGGLVVATRKHPEPTYNGRPLSEWLDQTRSDIDYTQRVHAVQQIGTNALPLLLEWIQPQPSELEIKLRPLLKPFHIDPSEKKFRHRDEALTAFEALGEEAKPAILALTPLLDSPYPTTQVYATKALGAIGKTALPALLDVVTNPLAHRNCDRFFPGAEISQLGTNAFLAKPVMLDHIRDPDSRVASAAIYVLGNLGRLQNKMALPPESTADIVPALCTALDTTNTDILLETMQVLPEFHSNALPAVPFLVQKLTYNDSAVRVWASNALMQIDPQALQRAQNP